MTTSTAHNIWRREFANARLLNGAFPRQVDPVEFAAWKMRVLRMTFGAVFPRVMRPAFGPGLAGGGAANGLLNNLIAFWPGNETSGLLLDAHTNALHMTIGYGCKAVSAGLVYPTARVYGGWHNRPSDDALLSTGNVDFTIAAWIYPTSLSASYHMAASKYEEYAIGTFGSQARFYHWKPASLSGETLTVSSWSLLVAWHSVTAGRFYIQTNDGTVYSDARSAAPNDTANPFLVGSRSAWAEGFSGSVGPTMFWKSAADAGGVLTAAQRTALYNAGAGLAYSEFTA